MKKGIYSKLEIKEMIQRHKVCEGDETHGGRTQWTDLGGINSVQASLRDIVGVVPDHHNKASVTIKRVFIFLLVEGLFFNL